MTMILHKGAEHVDAEALEAIPTPEATPTWQPIPHHELLRQVKTTLQKVGANISAESHGVTPVGDRYFGLLSLTGGTERPYQLQVAVRNSHDKSISAGIAVGNKVFVCDNLSFSGDIRLARKHTARIFHDLPHLVLAAVNRIPQEAERQDQRIAAYQKRELSLPKANHLLMTALRQRVVTGSHLARIVREYDQPRHPEFEPRNLWSLFNCVTEIAKGTPDHLLVHRTTRLYDLCDHFATQAS